MRKSTQLLMPAERCLRQRRGMPLRSWRPWQWCGLLLISTTICTGTREEPAHEDTMQQRNISKVSLDPQRKPLRHCVSRIFTKWPLVFPAPDQKSLRIAQLLAKEFVPMFHVPEALLFDRGANLLSHLMTDLYTMLEIHKLNTISYHPKSNGMVERINRNLIWMRQSHATKYGVQWGRYLCAGTGFVGISKYPPPPMRTPKRSHHTTEC